MTGHTKWSELRDRVYSERPGMAERVATLRDRAELDATETWEIELEAEAVTDTPSNGNRMVRMRHRGIIGLGAAEPPPPFAPE